MQDQLGHSIAHAPAKPWIPDCDTTIKVLYGKQDGAVASYNPHQPGRPSHAIRIPLALVRYIVERILACASKPNSGLTALETG